MSVTFVQTITSGYSYLEFVGFAHKLPALVENGGGMA